MLYKTIETVWLLRANIGKMENRIKVSIIVPVYNVEKYLKKNIDSLSALEITDVEIIYIDDGSTDESLAILENAAKLDSRIRIVRKKNGGLSSARNRGIMEAHGAWILFVDGDDWVDAGFLEKFIDEIDDNCQIIGGKYQKVSEAQQVSQTCMESGYQVEYEIKSGKDCLYDNIVEYTACLYIYRTSFLKKSGVLFPEGLLHEDMEFVPKIFSLAPQVKMTNINYYRYLTREGSISQTKNMKRSKDLLIIAKHMSDFWQEFDDKKLQEYGKNYVAMLSEQSLHLAILADGDLGDLLNDEKLKSMMVDNLLSGTRMRDKIAAILIRNNCYFIYEKGYQIYSGMRNYMNRAENRE